jgi:hypothetical protein
VAFLEPAVVSSAVNRIHDWLDDVADSPGHDELRRRLVAFFDRRDRADPDALADETFRRMGETLEHGGAIQTTTPARYCYAVARLVLLEDLGRDRHRTRVDEPKSFRFDGLDQCLGELPAEERQLVVEYYRDVERDRTGHRRRMAESLGISVHALGIRVSRIRGALIAAVTRPSSGRG